MHAADIATLEKAPREHLEPVAARSGCLQDRRLPESLEVEGCQMLAIDPLSSLSRNNAF